MSYDVAATIVTYASDLDDVANAVASYRRTSLNAFIQVVDNCSPGSYVEDLRRTVDVPVIRSDANRGFGCGHNIGFRQAPPSRYYLVLNPDVEIHRGALESMVDYLDGHSDVGLLSPRVLNPDGTQQYLNKRNPSVFDMLARRFLPGFVQRLGWVRRRMDHYVMRDRGYDTVTPVRYMTGCFMLFRRDLLRQTSLFDERFFMYLEDADVTRRIRETAQALYYPHASITHRWSRGSHRSWKLTWVTIQSAVRYFNKWGWKLL